MSIVVPEGVCVDWSTNVESTSDVFAPVRVSNSACGFGSADVYVWAKFPTDAIPGATASGILEVLTNNVKLPCATARVLENREEILGLGEWWHRPRWRDPVAILVSVPHDVHHGHPFPYRCEKS